MSRVLPVAAVCFSLLLVGAARPAPAAARDPILFVHGWASDAWLFNAMTDRFENDGWSAPTLVRWSYNWRQSNATTAGQLADKVDEILATTGAGRVDIVSHSMGGLSSRYYLKNLGGTETVDDWVSIGGPNHGTVAAFLCWDRSCVDMRPGSRFLAQLNRDDETPGATRYGTVWSWCDEVILPHSSTPLGGATNWGVGCMEHIS
ncbi:MAG: esterase/lipase family protein, partial [Nocardioidaceae bacterium]